MPYLKQAIAVSPDFVDAYALLAEEYGIAGYLNLKLDVEDNWEQAKSFATKALQLDSSNSNAWSALAYTQRNDRDYELSLRSLEKALSIDSTGFNLQQYGLLLCVVNKPSKGDKFMQKALRIDPLSQERIGGTLRTGLFNNNPNYVLNYLSKNTFRYPEQLFTALVLKGEYEKAVSYYLDSVEVTLAPKLKMELSAVLEKEGWKAFCDREDRRPDGSGRGDDLERGIHARAKAYRAWRRRLDHRQAGPPRRGPAHRGG